MGLSLLIVVLHYSGLDDTLECLASLERQAHRGAHTVVIDNGSAERPAARLKAEHPWIEVIDLPENLGWSGGNNVGIALALERGFDVVCLLNNDTVLPRDAIGTLMASLAFLGPCILHPAIDSYAEDDQVQLDPTIPQPPNLVAVPVPGHPSLFEINTVNGSCLMAHLVLLRTIGLIDERFFLLYEDIDLGARAMAAGYRVYCDTAVRIQHKESRSFGGRRRPIKTYYGIRNMLLYSKKHYRSQRSFLSSKRTLAWTVWSTAEAAGGHPGSWWGVFCWCLSSDIFARAIRMGVRDYLLRRFGRINKRDEDVLRAGGAP